MTEASPYKSALEALVALRKTFRVVSRCYMERIEAEITHMHDQVAKAALLVPADGGVAIRNGGGGGTPARPSARPAASPLPDGKIADLRDMLILLRTLEVKPEAGRRKDLKKIESMLADLRQLTERWP